MSKVVNHTIIGFYVVVFFCLSIFIFFWLYYKQGHVVYEPYMLYVHDDVTGLAIQSPVRYTGVQVGFVKNIELDKNNPQLVKILLDIKAGTPILTSTVATLSVQGITGSAYVSLVASTSNAPLLTAQEGESYPIIHSKPSFLNQITNSLPEIAGNIQTLTQRINDTLSIDNLTMITHILKNIDAFTGTLSSTSPELTQIMTSLNKTMKNAEVSSQTLPELLKQTNQTMATIDSTVKDIQKTSDHFDTVLKSAEVLVTNTTQQLLPSTNTFMVRLSRLSSTLQQLSNEISRNPSVLIRGKEPAIPGPGEKQ